MTRSPILLIVLAGILLLFLIAAVSFLQSGQDGTPQGGLGGNTIPQTGQEGTQTPSGILQVDGTGTPDENETPQVTSEAGIGQETAMQTPRPTVTPASISTLRPSSTPLPTNTPVPTFTPAPTQTATLTASPTSEATATQRATATQQAPPTSEASPTAGSPITSNEQAVQAYREATTEKIRQCNAALDTFEQIANQLTEDLSRAEDPQTRSDLDENLEEINESCAQLGSAEPVPPQYARIDITLDSSAREFQLMTETLTRSVDNLDPLLFAQALDHLQNGIELANQAASQRP